MGTLKGSRMSTGDLTAEDGGRCEFQGYGGHLRLKASFKKYRGHPQPGNEVGHPSVERNIF
jgi:hypothetical protein